MLQVEDLSCVRSERSLWQGVRFELPPGKLLQITGANGSGKTSLLRILAGLAVPNSGRMDWCGIPVSDQKLAYLQQLYYFSHQSGVKNELSVRENIRFRLRRPCTEKSLSAAIGQAGLSEHSDHFGRQLSQGQKQRVALAALFLSNVPLWILDEPFANLDSEMIEKLKTIFVEKLQAGGLIILTTHRTITGTHEELNRCTATVSV